MNAALVELSKLSSLTPTKFVDASKVTCVREEVVGVSVGADDGTDDGCELGVDEEGAAVVGNSLGSLEGCALGSDDGIWDGFDDGSLVG